MPTDCTPDAHRDYHLDAAAAAGPQPGAKREAPRTPWFVVHCRRARAAASRLLLSPSPPAVQQQEQEAPAPDGR